MKVLFTQTCLSCCDKLLQPEQEGSCFVQILDSEVDRKCLALHHSGAALDKCERGKTVWSNGLAATGISTKTGWVSYNELMADSL